MNAASADKVSATPAQIAKPERTHSIRNGLLCALAMAAAVLISNPSAKMPFMDDFSYIKSAVDFAHTGHIVYNGWATAMLGWQIPWGALYIKVFGFSFTGMRLSMLPLAMLTVFLFHQILRRFGVNAPNSVLGALTLGISPLFLPMASSFMTDVPGLLVILVCMYMCQRAVAATSDRSTLLWLCAASAVNVAGGTVRQIAWLGALVMVPCTAWLLRQRRGTKVAAGLLFLFAFAGVEVCMNWFLRQPYSVPQPILPPSMNIHIFLHVDAQLVKTVLCLLLALLPLSVAWIPSLRQFSLSAKLRLSCVLAVILVLMFLLERRDLLRGWMLPWLTPVYAMELNLLPEIYGKTTTAVVFWPQGMISVLVLMCAIAFFEDWGTSKKRGMTILSKSQMGSWRPAVWILGPYCLCYFGLLTSCAAHLIWDRYVLGLIPCAVIVLLLRYQQRFGAKLSRISVVVTTLVGLSSIAATHDFFVESRALVHSIQTLRSSGVASNSIQASSTMLGWARDGWIQIQGGGHLNDARIKVPAGAYEPTGTNSKHPAAYTSWFSNLTPVISPRYFVVSDLLPGLAASNFPPVHYTTWLPPFHRAIYVQQLK